MQHCILLSHKSKLILNRTVFHFYKSKASRYGPSVHIFKIHNIHRFNLSVHTAIGQPDVHFRPKMWSALITDLPRRLDYFVCIGCSKNDVENDTVMLKRLHCYIHFFAMENVNLLKLVFLLFLSRFEKKIRLI